MNIGFNAALLDLGDTYRATGLSNYIYHLLRGLSALDDKNEYTVYTGAWARDLHCQKKLDLGPNFHFSTTRVPTHRPVARLAWEQTLHAASTSRLDVIHSPVNVVPLLSGTPRVVTIHDLAFLLFDDRHPPAKRNYLRVMTRLSVERADAIMAVSENTRQDIIRLLGVPPEKVTTVPLGVDREYRWLGDDAVAKRDMAAFRANKGLPDRYFFYLGTLEPRKNIPLLLRAYATLRQGRCRGSREEPPKLVIAGPKGWLYEEIFELVKSLKLESHVIFPGFLPQNELVWWYNAALAFVYLSAYEGFGLPSLQAMACGVPVVLNNTAALSEVAGGACRLVSAEDAQVVGATLRELAESSELRSSLRERGLSRAAQFSWRRTAELTMGVYEGIRQRKA